MARNSLVSADRLEVNVAYRNADTDHHQAISKIPSVNADKRLHEMLSAKHQPFALNKADRF